MTDDPETEIIIMDNQELMTAIGREWKPSESRCGKLVQRKGAVWHYSAALSNSVAIAWSGIPHSTGHLTLHEIAPDFTDTVNVVYFDQLRVLENIIASVPAFNDVWNYGWGWNCEHWARLVTTGEPKSYQIANAFFGMLNLIGLCYRGEAIPCLVGQVAQFNRNGLALAEL